MEPVHPTPSAALESSAAQATERVVLTFSKHARDTLAAQAEAFCKQSGLRFRIQEERGAKASLYVIDLRGEPERIRELKGKFQGLAANEILFQPSRRPLPRAAVSAISFFIGLGLVVALFALAS